jgi:hypothetical protein
MEIESDHHRQCEYIRNIAEELMGSVEMLQL